MTGTLYHDGPVAALMAFEDGDLTDDEVVDLFGDLVKSGLAWTLQGFYGRTAANLIQLGYLTETGEVDHYPSED